MNSVSQPLSTIDLTLFENFSKLLFSQILITFDIESTVKNIKMGQVQFRTDKGGNVHLLVGKADFNVEQLKENIHALYDTLLKLKPSTSKGVYIKNIVISSTMGPGLNVNPSEFTA